MSGFVARESQFSNIQWGRVVAGAAVTTGAVLVGVAIANGGVPILSDVADGVKQVAMNLFNAVKESITGVTPPPAGQIPLDEPGMFSKFGEYLHELGTFLETNAKALGMGGATVAAGGILYNTTHPEIKVAPVAASVSRMQNLQMGFAAREQMRAVNALMESRMQMFGAQDRQV